jgi:hypothetical protein
MAGKILEHSAPNPKAAAGSIAEASMKRLSNRKIRAAQQLSSFLKLETRASAEFV